MGGDDHRVRPYWHGPLRHYEQFTACVAMADTARKAKVLLAVQPADEANASLGLGHAPHNQRLPIAGGSKCGAYRPSTGPPQGEFTPSGGSAVHAVTSVGAAIPRWAAPRGIHPLGGQRSTRSDKRGGCNSPLGRPKGNSPPRGAAQYTK